MTFFLIFKITS